MSGSGEMGTETTAKHVSVDPPKPFPYNERNRHTAALRWVQYKREFDIYLGAGGIDHDPQKKHLLLWNGGAAIRSVYYSESKKPEEDTYAETCEVLLKHFRTGLNRDAAILMFRQAVQKESELLGDYVVRLREMAKDCGYTGTEEEEEIRRQVLVGTTLKGIKGRMVTETCTLDKVLQFGKNLEADEVMKETMNMRTTGADRSERTIAAVHKSHRGGAERSGQSHRGGGHRGGQDRRGGESSRSWQKPKGGEGQGFGQEGRRCYSCGLEFPHKDRQCPAKDRRCNKCNAMGHLAKCCKARAVKSLAKSSDEEFEDEDYKGWVGNIRSGIFPINACSAANGPHMNVKVDGTECKMLIDSGANDNLIDEATYEAWPKKPKLNQSRARLHAYNSTDPLKIVGEFQAAIEVAGRKLKASIKVVGGCGGCILGFETARELGLFQGELFKPKVRVAVVSDRYSELMREFSMVFTEKVGVLKDYKVKLHIDRGVEPKQVPYRRAPYHLLEAIEKELDKLVENDIIEPVVKPPTWVSTMVAVPKAKKEGEVRITVDSRLANKAIKRIRYVTPTTEQIAYDMNGAKVISRIDLNKAYHQLLMEEESRDITTFITHKGLFRFKRLNMGVCSASETFQHVIQTQVLNGLKGVRNLADDIIVFGKDQAEHDERLYKLCERLKLHGLTASPTNCSLGVTELVFFGLRVSSEGVAIGEDKVKALKEAGEPKDSSELRSFLGLAVYCSSHIPDLATLAEPLWELVKEGVEFKWLEKHKMAMEAIKSKLITSALGYFNVKWITEVTVDASPVGLAAVCAQINPQNSKERRVITYISRTLSDVERRYSQVEKEALAVIWSCERLALYLTGKWFRLVTDNKAVQFIYSNPSSKPPLRIERWALRLMCFDFEIVHKAGRENIADFMSRNPVDGPNGEYEEDERYINFVADHAIPVAVTREALAQATKEDQKLQALAKKVRGEELGKGEIESLAEFERVRRELTVTSDGLVLRDKRVVVPEKLRKEMVMVAHEGHMGMAKMKALLRTKVWFPKMDEMVEEVVEACFACQLETKGHPEPIKSTEMPKMAWDQLAMDFFGPLPNGHELMVVIDEHSRMPVIKEVVTTASEYVIPALDEIFSLLGIPTVLKTDNGPPFNGANFSKFCEYMGIKHRKIAPENPQANGNAEKFMRNVAKTVRSAISEKKDWKYSLNQFLRNYRSAPHATTGVAPNELMFGRNKTSRLPDVETIKAPGGVAERAINRDKKLKAAAKEYADGRRRAKHVEMRVGDAVVAKQKKKDKWTTAFGPETYEVVEVKGAMVTVSGGGRTFARDRSYFKKLLSGMGQPQQQATPDGKMVNEEQGWRALNNDQSQAQTQPTTSEARTGELATSARNSVAARATTRCAMTEENSVGDMERYPSRNRKQPDRFGY